MFFVLVFQHQEVGKVQYLVIVKARRASRAAAEQVQWLPSMLGAPDSIPRPV